MFSVLMLNDDKIVYVKKILMKKNYMKWKFVWVKKSH